MPSWLKDFLGGLVTTGEVALKWIAHSNTAWENWVDAMIHKLWRDVMQTYIILTWDIANFSYFTASFAATARHWVEWLAYERIPNAIKVSEFYAYLRVRQERAYRRAADFRTRAMAYRWFKESELYAYLQAYSVRIDARAARARLKNFLLHWIAFVAAALQRNIDNEIANRRAAIARVRAELRQDVANLWQAIKAIIPTVNKMAATGYNSVRPAQASLLSKIVDDLATDNPLVKDVVGKLAGIILDLAEVDDPVARIAASFLLKEVIDRLGVDKLAGGLASQLLGQFLGGGPPQTLRDVDAAIAARLNASETQWQQFYANGGDDIEQLGNQKREEASPLFLVPLAGYFAAAVADPEATAAVTDAVVTPAARAVLTPLLAALEVI